MDNTQPSPTVVDLFCGCGGFSHGFLNAGFSVVTAVDIWDKAIESYRKNHPSIADVFCKDITSLETSELSIKSCDVVAGGPPCQGFSVAGKRQLGDPRNDLFRQFLRFIEFLKPKFTVMENVVGILSMKAHDGTLVMNSILKGYDEAGYHVTYQVLNAADYGVPQKRRRVIFIGVRKDLVDKLEQGVSLFPDKTCHLHVPVSSVLTPRDQVDKKYFLSEKALLGIATKKQRMKEKNYGFGAQFLDLTRPCYTIPARYWRDGYDALVRYSETDVRRLTEKELALVQTFPKEYHFHGNKRQVIEQIGNAVPPLLAFHIAKHLRSILSIVDVDVDR